MGNRLWKRRWCPKALPTLMGMRGRKPSLDVTSNNLMGPPAVETEYKFFIPAENVAEVEQALLHGTSESVRLRSHYFDTSDATLRSNGISLRIREEGSRRLQTLKWGGDGLISRQEHEVALGGIHEPWTSPNLALHRRAGLGSKQSRLLAELEISPGRLQEVFVVDCERIRSTVPVDGGEIEFALDRGEVKTGSGPTARSASIQELELELKSGQASVLAPLAKVWAAKYGLWLGSTSKSSRGWALRDGTRVPARAAKAKPGRLSPPVLTDLIRLCVSQVLPAAAVVGEGTFDDEDIHRLRVGLRRLRTVLSELHKGSGRAKVSWQDTLATTFQTLGQWRDRTHVLATVIPEMTGAGGPPLAVEDVTGESAPSPQAAVRASAFQSTLIDLIGFAKTDRGEGDMRARAFEKLMRRRMRRLFRKIAAAAPTFADLPAEDQHQVRKRLKKLRYLVEFGAPFLDRRAQRRFIDRVKPLQDALGQLNDSAVAQKALQDQAERRPAAWFGAGWLAGRRPALAANAQKLLVHISKHGRLFD